MTAQQGRAPQVWIVNHHAPVPTKDGREGRHLAFARHLPKHGWTASLLVASTTHPSGRQRMPGARLRTMKMEGRTPVVWVRAMQYHSKFQRLIGMGAFTIAVLGPGITRGLARPDVVVGCTVHLPAAWAGLRLAKRHGVPFVYEIGDVWPETLIDLGQISKHGVPARWMSALSRHLAREAAAVVSPLPRIDLNLLEMGVAETPVFWVPNGTELRAEAQPLSVPQREYFTFMYLGAHGAANGLSTVLSAFDLASTQRPDLKMRLRLVGDGPKKKELWFLAQSLGSSENILFEDQIPESCVLDRARESDCLVANVLDKPVYRFGLGLNKFYSYLSAFRPALIATSYPNPIAESDAGIVVPSDDVGALGAAMVELATLPVEERTAMAERGYRFVRTNYGYEALTAGFAEVLNSVTSGARRSRRVGGSRRAGRARRSGER